MARRLLRFAFTKLGRHYPRVALVIQFQAAYVVVLAGLGLLTLYQDMSGSDFLRLLVVIEGLVVAENAINLRRTFRILRPVTDWLGGDRTPASTVRAWQTVVSFPSEYVRGWKAVPIFLSTLPFSVYATAELDLPAHSVLILFAGGLVVLLYGLTLRFFLSEMVLRPVVEEIAGHLPDDLELGRGGIPLRWKLLLGLPAINIITGVVVSGLSTSGQAQIEDLGLDVLVAVLVAFTTSLELTLLLSRSILLPIQDLREATARVAAGDLTTRVPVLSADETGHLAQAFNAMVSGLGERERLHEAFGAFVAPEVADRVLEEGIELEGVEAEVTVLFLDIRGFTAFAERSSAREVVAQLNRFYDLVVPVLARHGGHANKFIGDGLLGVFGAPDRLPDHADRAVEAALEIAALVHATYNGTLRIGIGVNSGPVVAGTVGGGGRVEFTVIGDAVNTAARVEEVTRVTGDDLLITEATRCLLTRELGTFEERPPVGLKGKSEAVRLYALRLAHERPAAAGRMVSESGGS